MKVGRWKSGTPLQNLWSARSHSKKGPTGEAPAGRFEEVTNSERGEQREGTPEASTKDALVFKLGCERRSKGRGSPYRGNPKNCKGQGVNVRRGSSVRGGSRHAEGRIFTRSRGDRRVKKRESCLRGGTTGSRLLAKTGEWERND